MVLGIILGVILLVAAIVTYPLFDKNLLDWMNSEIEVLPETERESQSAEWNVLRNRILRQFVIYVICAVGALLGDILGIILAVAATIEAIFTVVCRWSFRSDDKESWAYYWLMPVLGLFTAFGIASIWPTSAVAIIIGAVVGCLIWFMPKIVSHFSREKEEE